MDHQRSARAHQSLLQPDPAGRGCQQTGHAGTVVPDGVPQVDPAQAMHTSVRATLA
jgi:hypothetical protein